jgi:hypothetical protein
MFANLCVNLFTGSTQPVSHKADPEKVQTGLSHDGLCPCDGLDENCPYIYLEAQSQYDRDVEYYGRDFQIEIAANGDYIIYDSETPLGTVKANGTCNFKEIMVQYMWDHD